MFCTCKMAGVLEIQIIYNWNTISNFPVRLLDLEKTWTDEQSLGVFSFLKQAILVPLLLFGEFVFAGHDVYRRCLFAYAKLKSPHVSHRHLCSGETNPTFVSRGVTPGPGCAFDFVRHNNLSASVRGLETQYYTFARTCGPSARNNSIADARFNTPLSYLQSRPCMYPSLVQLKVCNAMHLSNHFRDINNGKQCVRLCLTAYTSNLLSHLFFYFKTSTVPLHCDHKQSYLVPII